MPDFVRFWDVVRTLTASPLDVDVCLVLPLRSDPERASLDDVYGNSDNKELDSQKIAFVGVRASWRRLNLGAAQP